MILFFLKKEEIDEREYNLVIYVKKDVNNKGELFEMFSSKLQFPTYFGKNWDAFYDCLCNLDHIHEKKILILHEDLPFKEPEERKIYIDLILDFESSFSLDQNYKVDIAFPLTQKDKIINRKM